MTVSQRQQRARSARFQHLEALARQGDTQKLARAQAALDARRAALLKELAAIEAQAGGAGSAGGQAVLAALGKAGSAGASSLAALESALQFGGTAVATAAELALGQFPATLPISLALEIGKLFGFDPLGSIIGSFSGKPKLLDTAQAAQRLSASPFQALRDLGTVLTIFVRNGVPLSTSNPKLQGQLRSAIQGTVQTLLAAFPLLGSASQVSALLNQALTSENGARAIAQLQGLLAAQVRQLQGGALAHELQLTDQVLGKLAALPKHASLPAGQTVRVYPGEPPPVGTILPGAQLPAGTPAPVARLHSLLQDSEIAGEVALCVGLNFVLGPEATAGCLAKVLGHVVEQGARSIIQSIETFFTNQRGRRPPSPTAGGGHPLSIQPTQPAPLVDMTKPCPECERGLTARQRQELQQARDQLTKEIEIEQSQQKDQTLERAQTELQHLHDLESQPIESRDITSELQQKYALQRQLDTIESPTPQPLQPGERAPLIEDNARTEARELQHQTDQQALEKPVQFCVGCKSQEDAILFLNGESAACSVIPGTTKPIQVAGG